jgi:hypothetical protein
MHRIDKNLSFGQKEQASDRLAQRFEGLGVGARPGDEPNRHPEKQAERICQARPLVHNRWPSLFLVESTPISCI